MVYNTFPVGLVGHKLFPALCELQELFGLLLSKVSLSGPTQFLLMYTQIRIQPKILGVSFSNLWSLSLFCPFLANILLCKFQPTWFTCIPISISSTPQHCKMLGRVPPCTVSVWQPPPSSKLRRSQGQPHLYLHKGIPVLLGMFLTSEYCFRYFVQLPSC